MDTSMVYERGMRIQSRLCLFLDSHGDRVLQASCGVAMAFFLSFILALSVATSAIANENSVTCNGTDLLERYRNEQPEKYDAILAASAATPNGSEIFWKIEKDGVAASWLLGTMHLADPRIAKLDGAKRRAFDASEVVIVENVAATDPAQAMAAMLENRHLTMYTDGTTLDQHLDPEILPALREAAEKRGMPFGVVKAMRPWLVAASLALPACEAAMRQQNATFLDALIAQEARSVGKRLIGLETMTEQFEAMASAPETFHLKMLEDTIAIGALAEDVMETMKRIYIAGEIGMILPLTKSVSPDVYESPEYEELSDSLIVSRNHKMAERSMPHLENGNIFIAVGALHLPGEEGLVQLFEEAGYTLTPVSQ